ncbi:hypothetical protein [Asanoa siamensis]|uniref:Uncharacterized protein n=1 Tax=Asanoa siamensis TaxID=926357 RepID=A0ABQ4CRK4_9ACTN|nr:hypothetical protein [Asanoa siamensis]GIF73902.1 hypothetical protein Asi02nite_34200 [Asanoa siamensis]
MLAETPTMAFALGGIWTVLGLGQVITLAFGGDGGALWVARVVLAVITVLLGVGYLASAAAHRRRERGTPS